MISNEKLPMLMEQSLYHIVKLVTKNERTVIGKVTLHENDYDSGEGEACVGIASVDSPNVFYEHEIKTLDIIK